MAAKKSGKGDVIKCPNCGSADHRDHDWRKLQCVACGALFFRPEAAVPVAPEGDEIDEPAAPPPPQAVVEDAPVRKDADKR